MKKRPLALIGFAFYLSIFFLCLFEQYLPPYAFYGLPLITAVLATITFFIYLKKDKSPSLEKKTKKDSGFLLFIIISVFCIASMLTSTFSYRHERLAEAICGNSAVIKGTIVSNAEENNGAYYYSLRVYEYNGQKINTYMRYRSQERLEVKPYDAVEIQAISIYEFSGNNVLSSLQLKSKRESFGVYGDVIQIMHSESKHPATYILKFRTYIKETLSENLPKQEGAFLLGLLIGDTSAINTPTYNEAKIAGITHIFSVSGLHVSLWSLFIMNILEKTRLNKLVRALLASLCVIFILALTGFDASACRSGIMMLILLLGQSLSRDADSLNSLGLAAIILLLFNPYYAHSVSFNLSFFATLGILLFTQPVNQKLNKLTSKFIKSKFFIRPVRQINSSLAVSFSVMIFTMPLMIYYFHSLSVISPLANLLTILPSSAAMVLSGLTALLSPISFLFYPITMLAGLIAKYIINICHLLSKIPAAFVPVSPYMVALSAAIALISAFFFSVIKKTSAKKYFFKTAYLLFAVILLLTSVAAYFIPTYSAEIDICDTGNGSAIIIRQNNQSALLGCGGKAGCENTIAYALKSMNIFTLDYLLIPRETETENRAEAKISADFSPKRLDAPKTREIEQPDIIHYSIGTNTQISYKYSAAFSAALLEINNSRFIICFLPSSDFSEMPEEWTSGAVLITRSAIPETLDTRAFACVIINTNDGKLVYAGGEKEDAVRFENISIKINAKGQVNINAPLR